MTKNIGIMKGELVVISAYCKKNNLTVAEYIAQQKEKKEKEKEDKSSK